MAVDWGLGVVDPSKSFKAGSDYVNQLYDTQANKSAAQKITTGDYRGAAADVAGRGDLKNTQALMGEAVNADAGTAYAQGNVSGAANILAKGGNITGAETLADKQAATFQKQHQYLQNAVPVLTGILQKSGPQALSQAFEQIAPELQSIGTPPDQIDKLRQGFASNPEQTLQVLGATAQKKYTFQRVGEVIAVFDEANPSAGPVTTFKGEDNPNDWEVKNIIQGGQEQSVRVNKKTGETQPLGAPGTRFNPNASAVVNLSPDAKNYVAEQYQATGALPNMGFGRGGAQVKADVINLAAQNAKAAGTTGGNAVAVHATTKADTQALGQVSKTRNMVESFEQTATKNADLAERLSAKGTAGSGVPVLNAWIQAGRRSIAGNPDVAAFDLALTTFKNEYARVVNSATGGGVTTDSARSELESKINAAQTPAQLKAVLAVARVDMENRRTSLIGQENDLKSRLGGQQQAAPASAQPAAGARKIGRFTVEPAGP